MPNRTIALLRHADFNIDTGNIDETNRQLARKKWEELLQSMWIADNVASIILASSILPRAIQTLEAIREGLGLPKEHPIYSSEYLIGSWDLHTAFRFIEDLPKTPFLVVVSHKEAALFIARRLGMKNDTPWKSGHLEWAIFPEGIW